MTGEHIKQNGKKYPIFSINIQTDYRDSSYEKDIEQIALKSNTIVRFHENSTIISSAMVTS